VSVFVAAILNALNASKVRGVPQLQRSTRSRPAAIELIEKPPAVFHAQTRESARRLCQMARKAAKDAEK